MMKVILVLALAATVACQDHEAIAVMQSAAANDVTGTVTFTQVPDSDTVTVAVDIQGVDPSTTHGFHIHQYGDTTDLSRPSTGFHFFPHCPPDNCTSDQQHGLPPSINRHAGDMGNLDFGTLGNFTGSFPIGQGKMSLSDQFRSIVGRAVVLHSGEDDGGQPFGNAGSPLAGGVIGFTSNSNPAVSGSAPTINILCILHNVTDLSGGTDNNAVAYMEVDGEDLTSDAAVRVKLLNHTVGQNTVFQIMEFGDMTDVPTSLGSTFQSAPSDVHTVTINDANRCGDTFYHDSTTPRTFQFVEHVGRACVMRTGGVGGDIVAAGVWGLANPDENELVFFDQFFKTATCEVPRGGDGDSGLSDSEVAAVVTVAVVLTLGVAIAGMYVWYKRQLNKRTTFKPAPPASDD